MFWFFGHEAYGILAPPPGIEPAPLALEGEVLTPGPPGKSQNNPILLLSIFYSTSTCFNWSWPSNTSCHREQQNRARSQEQKPCLWHSQGISHHWQVIPLNFWLCGSHASPSFHPSIFKVNQGFRVLWLRALYCALDQGTFSHSLVLLFTRCMICKWISLPVPQFSCLYKRHNNSPNLRGSCEA